LSQAIVVWSGAGDTAWPARDAERLAAEYGRDAVVELLPQIEQIVDDFYSSGAAQRAPDLATAGALAAAEFRQRHPYLSSDAVDALAWCYTFDWK
jgi:hypothetical protein